MQIYAHNYADTTYPTTKHRIIYKTTGARFMDDFKIILEQMVNSQNIYGSLRQNHKLTFEMP